MSDPNPIYTQLLAEREAVELTEADAVQEGSQRDR